MFLVLISFISALIFMKQKGTAIVTLPLIIVSFFVIAITAYLLGFLIELVFSRLGIKWLDK